MGETRARVDLLETIIEHQGRTIENLNQAVGYQGNVINSLRKDIETLNSNFNRVFQKQQGIRGALGLVYASHLHWWEKVIPRLVRIEKGLEKSKKE